MSFQKYPTGTVPEVSLTPNEEGFSSPVWGCRFMTTLLAVHYSYPIQFCSIKNAKLWIQLWIRRKPLWVDIPRTTMNISWTTIVTSGLSQAWFPLCQALHSLSREIEGPKARYRKRGYYYGLPAGLERPRNLPGLGSGRVIPRDIAMYTLPR